MGNQGLSALDTFALAPWVMGQLGKGNFKNFESGMCMQRGEKTLGRCDWRSEGMDWDVGSWLVSLRGYVCGNDGMDNLVGHGMGGMVDGLTFGMQAGNVIDLRKILVGYVVVG